jgi:hypothetical protein
MMLEVLDADGYGFTTQTTRDLAYLYMMPDSSRASSETHQSNKQERVEWTDIVPSKSPIPKRDVVVVAAEHDHGRGSDTGFQQASDSLDNTLR